MRIFYSLTLAVILTALVIPLSVNAITRDEIMVNAESYANHSWTPTEDNLFNGPTGETWRDINGNLNDIWVKTPDDRFVAEGGWWTANTLQSGLPYMWGGGNTLAQFDAGIASGKAAGDMDTSEPMGSSKAVGLDCSGFVSRSWGLPENIKYSTSQLASQAKKLTSFDELKPGDILLRPGSHVMLFDSSFQGPNGTEYEVFEARAGGWKVDQNTYLATPLDGTEGVNDTYKPYTYLKTADVMLTIDRSGSMKGTPIAEAKKASRLFVDLMEVKDQVGVVSFSSRASVNYSLTEIDESGSVKAVAQTAIDALRASGGTSIDSGLVASNDQIATNGKSTANRAIVLLTDGRSGHDPSILTDIKNNDTKVFTVGLGSPDESLLKNIAAKTGGSYHFAPSETDLQSIYDAISGALSGASDIERKEDTIDKDELQTMFAYVDSTVPSATFSVFWGGSDLDLTLVRPDGSIVDPGSAASDPDIDFISGDTYESYKVWGPMTGNWELRILGVEVSTGGEPYVASVKGQSAMGFAVNFDKDEYLPGDSVSITTELEHSMVDQPLRGALDTTVYEVPSSAIVGATVTALVTNPNGIEQSLVLFDDGTHNDGTANDGVYGVQFVNTSTQGSYTVRVDAEGTLNNVQQEPFTRSKTESIVVGGDSDGDGMPDAWEEVNSLDTKKDDASEDPDNDQLTNLEEYENKTDPHDPDSDDDGFSDYDEVQGGSDPNDEFSTPSTTDTTPPVTTVSLSGAVYDPTIPTYSYDVDITLTAEDEPGGSGVKSTEYSLDNGLTWDLYSSTFRVSEEGDYTLMYRSEDNAGNIEGAQSTTFSIIDMPPPIGPGS